LSQVGLETMHSGVVGDFAGWRELARARLAAAVPPDDVTWSDEKRPSLFGGAEGRADECAARRRRADEYLRTDGDVAGDAAAPSAPGPMRATPSISREILRLLEMLACYRDPGRWDLMYRLVWRVVHENRALLENDADGDVRTARLWSQAVSQDVHKMHAFLRFHETLGDDGVPCYVAWFEPQHEILRYTIPFFEKRFGNMRWMIVTPDGAAVWRGTRIEFIDSPGRSAVPREDSTHGLWRAYYRNICNVARVNPRMMQREMPQRYWRHLPEATEIHALLHENPRTLATTLGSDAAAENDRVPRAIAESLDRIAPVADSPLTCQRCSLWQRATQAVLGEGPPDARIMLVGEQPGDEEDLRGRPFVGPAGRVLDEALQKAGVSRGELFVTNAVKHFKWEPRGKRRLHTKPQQQEVRACSGWLEREIAAVAPLVIVALGGTAIRALTGMQLTIDEARKMELCAASGVRVVATYHPSAVLRAPDERRAAIEAALRADLGFAAAMVAGRESQGR
jgi:probable DNA metabolism protein